MNIRPQICITQGCSNLSPGIVAFLFVTMAYFVFFLVTCCVMQQRQGNLKMQKANIHRTAYEARNATCASYCVDLKRTTPWWRQIPFERVNPKCRTILSGPFYTRAVLAGYHDVHVRTDKTRNMGENSSRTKRSVWRLRRAPSHMFCN